MKRQGKQRKDIYNQLLSRPEAYKDLIRNSRLLLEMIGLKSDKVANINGKYMSREMDLT